MTSSRFNPRGSSGGGWGNRNNNRGGGGGNNQGGNRNRIFLFEIFKYLNFDAFVTVKSVIFAEIIMILI